MNEKCQKCHAEEDDLRTLWMSCGYEMRELNIPLTYNPITLPDADFHRPFYTMEVCKDCRSEWMQAIQAWWMLPTSRESCGSGIFIRRFGANIEITEEEWHDKFSSQEPVRVIQDDE